MRGRARCWSARQWPTPRRRRESRSGILVQWSSKACPEQCTCYGPTSPNDRLSRRLTASPEALGRWPRGTRRSLAGPSPQPTALPRPPRRQEPSPVVEARDLFSPYPVYQSFQGAVRRQHCGHRPAPTITRAGGQLVGDRKERARLDHRVRLTPRHPGGGICCDQRPAEASLRPIASGAISERRGPTEGLLTLGRVDVLPCEGYNAIRPLVGVNPQASK